MRVKDEGWGLLGIFESYCMVLQYKVGGIFLLRLNIRERPIANKYREGKLKRTLKRELKLPETVIVEGLTVGLRRESVRGILLAH